MLCARDTRSEWSLLPGLDAPRAWRWALASVEGSGDQGRHSPVESPQSPSLGLGKFLPAKMEADCLSIV